MVEVQIYGKSYPLCLTVAALDEVTARCGGLDHVGDFLDGKSPQHLVFPEAEDSADRKTDLAGIASNTTWLLSVLLREGENNRLMLARMDGETAERRTVPTLEDLAQLLTIGSALKCRATVMEAVTESMSKEIEALYPKNVKDVEQA